MLQVLLLSLLMPYPTYRPEGEFYAWDLRSCVSGTALNTIIIADICRKENSFLQITNLNYSMISMIGEFFFAE